MPRTLSFPRRVEQSLLTEFREGIWRPFMRAVRDYQLIQAGDRIAVCVSGGKDSMLLAKLMQLLQRHSEVPFKAVYLIMDPGYRPEIRRRAEAVAGQLDIPYVLFESDVFEAAEAAGPAGRPCFMCARMRRGCLYGRAQALGCNKIALGHHFDDVIETTVMAMLHGGQIQAMPPMLAARNFPGMRLIRPMYRVREADILGWRDAFGLEFIRCACRFAERQDEGVSKRQAVKALLDRLEQDDPKVKQNVFNSIHRVQLDTLVGWKTRGEEHSFLENLEDDQF